MPSNTDVQTASSMDTTIESNSENLHNSNDAVVYVEDPNVAISRTDSSGMSLF